METTHPQPVWASLTANNRPYGDVIEQSFKRRHAVFEGAPNGWAEARGANFTLYCGEGHGRGVRPVKWDETGFYVGVDEAPTLDGTDNKIVWERWRVRKVK